MKEDKHAVKEPTIGCLELSKGIYWDKEEKPSG